MNVTLFISILSSLPATHDSILIIVDTLMCLTCMTCTPRTLLSSLFAIFESMILLLILGEVLTLSGSPLLLILFNRYVVLEFNKKVIIG